jgi:hypothetical protein
MTIVNFNHLAEAIGEREVVQVELEAIVRQDPHVDFAESLALIFRPVVDRDSPAAAVLSALVRRVGEMLF